MCCAFDGDRADQPRSGAHLHEHGNGHQRPAFDGVVGDLRVGERVGGFARVCGIDECGRSESAADSVAPMVRGFSAEPVSVSYEYSAIFALYCDNFASQLSCGHS